MAETDEPRPLTPQERWALIRDVILFLMGAGGFTHEVLTGRGFSERPALLALSGLFMMGGKGLEVLATVVKSWRGGE